MKPPTSLQARRMVELLAYLTAAAEIGAPCPNNAEIMVHLALPNLCDANPLISRLEGDDLVRVERGGNRRRIQILATGSWTDWTSYQGGRPRSLVGVPDPDGGDQKYKEGFRGDLPLERYLRREPCARCGVRGDIGCKHQPLRVAA